MLQILPRGGQGRRLAHHPPHRSFLSPMQVRLQSLLGPCFTAALKCRLPQHLCGTEWPAVSIGRRRCPAGTACSINGQNDSLFAILQRKHGDVFVDRRRMAGLDRLIEPAGHLPGQRPVGKGVSEAADVAGRLLRPLWRRR